ncbi:hypothetical protein QVD99_003368 [Batrachochytrium dendrobatidis]|nr:hypothetical protein QVD99_003368 [Batrachochytrium dendrobatidis]
MFTYPNPNGPGSTYSIEEPIFFAKGIYLIFYPAGDRSEELPLWKSRIRYAGGKAKDLTKATGCQWSLSPGGGHSPNPAQPDIGTQPQLDLRWGGAPRPFNFQEYIVYPIRRYPPINIRLLQIEILEVEVQEVKRRKYKRIGGTSGLGDLRTNRNQVGELYLRSLS